MNTLNRINEILGLLGEDAPQPEQHHVSNHAVVTALNCDHVLLHSMWEDNDLDGAEEAEEILGLIERFYPGRFVVLDTGDYFTVPFDQENPGFETYDARYCLYVLTKENFAAIKDELFRVDAEWREEAERLARGEEVES